MPFSLIRNKQTRPDEMLPEGWQFYARPTNLEPPGTIFRIDGQGRRFIVERLTLQVSRGPEPGAASVRTVETRAGVLARVLGLDALGVQAGANRAMTLRFEISDPERESTSDVEADKVLQPFLTTMEFRPGNRYYIIRESRSATAMTFLVSDEQRGQIAGVAAIGTGATLELTTARTTAGLTELTRTFPQRLGVMFLPEEIAPVRAGLATDSATLGRLPVREGLDWVEPEYAVVRVFYGTDRDRTGSVTPATAYGAGRGAMTYGTCEVSIPRDHRMGDLEAPSIWKLEFRDDPAKHVVLLSAVASPKDEFFTALASRVDESTTRAAFLFIHGYNVTFEDAARRTAQIAYDLSFSGAPILYSWPSQGSVAAYTVDEANIEWAQTDLQQFLAEVFEQTGTRQLYVIAHSMGNRAMARAAAALLADKPSLKERLKDVILTAPDIDAAVFKRDIVPALTASGCPVTLYASSDDLALAASKKVHGSPRAGDAGVGLIVVPGVETIDATGTDTSFLRHSYFAEARSVLSDIYYLVRSGHRAGDRFGLRAIDTSQGRYWRFKE